MGPFSICQKKKSLVKYTMEIVLLLIINKYIYVLYNIFYLL